MSDDATAPNSRRKMAWTAGIALAALLVGSVLAVWAINYFRGTPATQPQAAPVAAAPAPQAVIIAPPVSTDPASLAARQQMLSAQLTALEQRTTAVTGQAANAYGNATRAEALLVAFATRRALDRGLPLGYLEQQLHDRFDTTQQSDVATIVKAARSPITLDGLRVTFNKFGPQLALGPANDGWGGAFLRMIGSLVVIHRDQIPSPVPKDRLDRIRRELADGQVEAAVEEVSRLPGATDASDWISWARQYVAVHKALDALDAAALQGRAANPAPPKP